MISAIAAGNCVVVKPSEHTPSTSNLLSEMTSSIFNENEVSVVQGDSSVGGYLISLNLKLYP